MSAANWDSDAAADLMAAYTPQIVDADLWATYRAVVISLVLASAPNSARNTRGRAAALLQWIADMIARGVMSGPSDVKPNLTFARIDQWLREAKGSISDTTRAYYRTQISYVVEAHRPGSWPRPEVITRWKRTAPYTHDGIDEIQTVARFAPALWSDRIDRILAMSLGAAANPADLRRLTTDHIQRRDRSLAVTLTGLQRRTILLAPRWTPLAVKHLDTFEGYWLTGTSDRPTRNFINRVGGRFADQLSTPFDVYRLRNTCLVGWIDAGLPTHVIRHAAGLTSLTAFDALMPFTTVTFDGFPLVVDDE